MFDEGSDSPDIGEAKLAVTERPKEFGILLGNQPLKSDPGEMKTITEYIEEEERKAQATVTGEKRLEDFKGELQPILDNYYQAFYFLASQVKERGVGRFQLENGHIEVASHVTNIEPENVKHWSEALSKLKTNFKNRFKKPEPKQITHWKAKASEVIPKLDGLSQDYRWETEFSDDSQFLYPERYGQYSSLGETDLSLRVGLDGPTVTNLGLSISKRNAQWDDKGPWSLLDDIKKTGNDPLLKVIEQLSFAVEDGSKEMESRSVGGMIKERMFGKPKNTKFVRPVGLEIDLESSKITLSYPRGGGGSYSNYYSERYSFKYSPEKKAFVNEYQNSSIPNEIPPDVAGDMVRGIFELIPNNQAINSKK